MRGIEELLPRFHRAGACTDHHFGAANRYPIDFHNRSIGLYLPAHQLERLGNRHDVVDAGSRLQSLDLVTASAPNCGHNGPLGTASDMRLITRFADSLDHV